MQASARSAIAGYLPVTVRKGGRRRNYQGIIRCMTLSRRTKRCATAAET